MSSTTYVPASDALRKSVRVVRAAYGTPAMASLLSGASGAVAVVDALATGAYADQASMAESTGVSAQTIGRLAGAGRIIVRLDAEAIGRESAILTAINYVGLKAAEKALSEGGLEGLLSASDAEKARRAEKQTASTEKGEKGEGEGEKGDNVETLDVSKAPFSKILARLEPLVSGLAARAPKRLDAAAQVNLVTIIDMLTTIAEGAGVDVEKVRAEIAA